jgi:SagB-type dehydrogenase family enzyme
VTTTHSAHPPAGQAGAVAGPHVVPAGTAPDQLGTVSNAETAVSRDYAEAVLRRSREPMEPLTFDIGWDDQPSRHKVYPGALRLPLPAPTHSTAPATTLLSRAASDGGWDLVKLATVLRLSCGVLDRRLRVNWNQDAAKRASYPLTTWGRGTASGGGMYPVETYLVSGARGPLLPGVYHYATGHDELERLVTGDVGAAMAAATGRSADCYLVAAVRFWKNSFKYNTFCYHVVTQDLGALLCSWDVLARSMGVRADRRLWFDDRAVDAVLGLDTATESAMAVVPLRWSTPGHARASGGPAHGAAVRGGASPAREPVRHHRVGFERSRRPLRFPLVDRVHAAALVDGSTAPGPSDAAPRPMAGTATVDLPAPPVNRLGAGLADVVRARRSSFGGFVSAPPLGMEDVATMLVAGATAGAAGSDVKPDGDRLTRLFVLANRVDGLPSGGYAYDPDGHRLHRVFDPQEPLGQLLQRHYLLTNYNTDQAAAVLVISGRLDAMLAAHGNRGYRVLNSEVGAVAQASYLACAALGVGCGAVLGMDSVAVNGLVGVGPGTEHDDERTLLFLLVGPERTDPADLDLRLTVDNP